MTFIKMGILSLFCISIIGDINGQRKGGILSHSEELELTQEQQDTIWKIEYEAKKSHRLSRRSEEGTDKIVTNRKAAMDTALDGILSDEQLVKWEEIKEENH